MLAPDTCAGLLVSGLQKLFLFFESKNGQIVLITLPFVRLAIFWLWRSGLPEAQELAVALAMLLAVISVLVLEQVCGFDESTLAMCLHPSPEATREIVNAR